PVAHWTTEVNRTTVLWTIAYSPNTRRPSRLATAILMMNVLPWRVAVPMRFQTTPRAIRTRRLSPARPEATASVAGFTDSYLGVFSRVWRLSSARAPTAATRNPATNPSTANLVPWRESGRSGG